MFVSRYDGAFQTRYAERTYAGGSSNDPPRRRRGFFSTTDSDIFIISLYIPFFPGLEAFELS